MKTNNLFLPQMQTTNLTRPTRLYRYSEHKWLVRSLLVGEFRLVPASIYGELTGDIARRDNELLREEIDPRERVTVTHMATGKPIPVIGDVVFRDEVGTNYYTLCFSSAWDPSLFDEFKGSDACLVIHHPDEVCELIHYYAEQFLRGWSGIDAAASYDGRNNFGPSFNKHWKYIIQKEWRFAWMPPQRCTELQPVCIRIGNIKRYAEIVKRPFPNKPQVD